MYLMESDEFDHFWSTCETSRNNAPLSIGSGRVLWGPELTMYHPSPKLLTLRFSPTSPSSSICSPRQPRVPWGVKTHKL
jgi:hypothetical protein